MFRTPSYINADLLPTDHNELLIKAIYPIAEKYNVKFAERELDLALRVAASDALGVFCAIQCYYMQVVNEEDGLSNIRLRAPAPSGSTVPGQPEMPQFSSSTLNRHELPSTIFVHY